jgi:hypothetical protein
MNEDNSNNANCVNNLLMRVVAHRCNSWLWLIGVIVCRLICQFVVIEAVYILTDESIGVVSASYMDYYR